MKPNFIDEIKQLKLMTREFAKFYDAEGYTKYMTLAHFLVNLHFDFQVGIWILFIRSYNYGIEIHERTYNIYYINADDIPDFIPDKIDEEGVAYMAYKEIPDNMSVKPFMRMRQTIGEAAVLSALKVINDKLEAKAAK